MLITNLQDLLFVCIANTGTLQHFPFLFQSASYHKQDWDTIEHVHQFPIHKDKAGKITAFYQVYGSSYNFIAVQDRGLKKVKFDTKNNKYKKWYKAYQDFKANTDASEGKFVKFEKELFKKAESSECRSIKIIYMTAGDYIVFDAALYYHGTIIPKQISSRSLVVLHDIKRPNRGESTTVQV